MTKTTTRLALTLLVFFIVATFVAGSVLFRAEKRIHESLLIRGQSLASKFSKKLNTVFSDVNIETPSHKRLELKNELAADCIAYPNCIAIYLVAQKRDGSLVYLTSKGQTRKQGTSSSDSLPENTVATIKKVFTDGKQIFRESSRFGKRGNISIFIPVKSKSGEKVDYVLFIQVNSKVIERQLLTQGLFPLGLSFILLLAVFGGFLVISRTYAEKLSTSKKLLLILASSLAIIILSTITMYATHHILCEKEYKRSEYFTRQVAQKINYVVVYPLKNTANSIAHSRLFYLTAAGQLPRDNEKILIALNTVKADYNASLAYILDRTGTVVACTPYDNHKTLTGNNYSFRPYFTEAMKGKPYLYLAVGVTTHRRGIYASSPISEGGTDPVGVFVIKVSLKKIDNILFTSESIMALVSPDGVIFATNKPDWLLHSTGLSETQRKRLIKSRQFGTETLEPLSRGIKLSGRQTRIGNKKFIITSAPVDIVDSNGRFWKIIRLKELRSYVFMVVCSGVLTALIALLVQLYFVSRMERQWLQKNIELSDRTQKILIENLSAAVVIIDAETHRIETVNPVAASYFGATAEEMIGKSCYGYLCPYTEETCPAMSRTEDIYSEEGKILRNDGTFLHIIRSIKVLDIKGEKKFLHTYVNITDLKKTEEALQESERNFRTFFESIGDMVTVATFDGRILYANSALIHRLGYSIDELSRMHVFDLRPPESRSEVEASCEAVFRGDLERCLIPLMAKDGSKIPVDTRVWKGKWNGTECIFCVSKDISKEQEALQKFEQLFRNNPVMMALTAIPDLVLADVNNAFEQTLGYSQDELSGKSWKDLQILAPSDLEKLERHLAEEDVLSNIEMRMRHKDGSIRYGLFSAQYLKANGQSSVLIAIKDITNLKKTEAYLKASEQRLRAITESVLDAIIMINSEGRVSFWNPAATTIFGYTKEEALKQPVADLIIPPSLRDAHTLALEDFAKCGKGKVFEKTLELKAVRKNGKEIPVSLSCAPVLIHNQWHAVGILRDITNEKMAQEKLVKMNLELKKAMERANQMAIKAEAANKAKSIFLANMSHEIRTPLNAILGFAQVLQSDPRFPEDLLGILDIINRSGEHLLGIINDILEISKIEAGRITLSLSTFNLHDLILEIERMFKPKAESKGLDFTIEYQPGYTEWIETDRIKLRQVLINIVGNAIKFTARGYVKVRISCEQPSGESNRLLLTFEVEDSGPGISPEEIKHLFKPFSQTSEGMKVGGTGLGLSISQGYLDVMNGKLSVKSKPNKGSLFIIQIPVKAFDLKAERASKKEEYKYVTGIKFEGATPKILIVDDNPGNRKLLGVILERVGFSVKKASGGSEALEIFEDWSPDLVFMDIRMPEMDGYETTKRIKKIRKDVPVVAVTASVFAISEKRFTEAGFDDYIRKPFKQNEIFEAIRKFVDVDYIFSSLSESKEEKLRDIDPDEMRRLPQTLLVEMRKSLEEGDINKLNSLILRLEPMNGNLARKLRQLAENYDYHSLGKILNL